MLVGFLGELMVAKTETSSGATLWENESDARGLSGTRVLRKQCENRSHPGILFYLKLLRRAQFVSFDLLPPPSLEKWDRSLLSSLRLINNNSSKQDAKKIWLDSRL
jgi:hypothetical protein